MKETKNIYVVLSQTGTHIAKIIRFLTKKPYSHTSISSSEELREMFSFCRYNPHFPLPAGFSPEYINTGVFNMYSNIPCEIYRFEVTDRQFDIYIHLIENFKKNSHTYTYNLLRLLTFPLGIAMKTKHKFVCSQFVAYVLDKCEIAKFDKDISLVIPEDFRNLPGGKLYYSGNLKTFSPPKITVT